MKELLTKVKTLLSYIKNADLSLTVSGAYVVAIHKERIDRLYNEVSSHTTSQCSGQQEAATIHNNFKCPTCGAERLDSEACCR